MDRQRVKNHRTSDRGPGRRGRSSAADPEESDRCAGAGGARPHTAVTRFAPIALPMTNLRTSLARALRRRANVFMVLLAQLDPKRYQGVAHGSISDVYGELLTTLDKRFPVWEPAWFEEEFEDEDEMLEAMEMSGIPVAPLGLDEDDLQYGGLPVLGLIDYLLVDPAQRIDFQQLRYDAGKAW